MRKKSAHKNRRKPMRQQAAMEYLVTYGLAVIILAVVLYIIYYYITAAPTLAQNTCTFSSGATCVQLEIGSNSSTTNAIVFISNAQEFALKDPVLTVNLSGGKGTFSSSCFPTFVLPGGAIVCSVPITNRHFGQGELVTGSLSLAATNCASVNSYTCTNPTSQQYFGTFTTHVSSLTNLGLKVALFPFSLSETANGTRDEIIATVTFASSGRPFAGATVNFTTPTPGVVVTPAYATTNQNGNATAYAYSYTIASPAQITASFNKYSASILIYFNNQATTTTVTTTISTSSTSTTSIPLPTTSTSSTTSSTTTSSTSTSTTSTSSTSTSTTSTSTTSTSTSSTSTSTITSPTTSTTTTLPPGFG